MGIELLVSVVGIVIATVISVWTYRKMNPKRQLRYRVEASPLLAAGAGAGDRLTIALEGRPVTAPQIVTLSLWSSGTADIASSAFDAGTPLTFDLGTPIVEEIPTVTDSGARLEVVYPDEIVLRPALIHRKFQSTIRVIVDGTPNARVNRVLPDIDVLRDGFSETTRAIQTSRKRLKVTPLLIWTGVLILGTAGLVMSLVVYAFDPRVSAPVGGISMLIMMIALVGIIVVGIYRFFRWVGRNVEARSGLR
ncbi:hypothetical protein [Microbacterium sp. Bi128]|uniref:hypothetical protein n=1 Tax=Microbacterium sp. Bi128 TaxID=2821115 RepID=UPI001D9BDE83|nr:hypothetical protein [Microbacterium sp. Bi128]CAH0165171.1 hypothetical protein SRABI128_00892 [Microbacterium sp. Bi128]